MTTFLQGPSYSELRAEALSRADDLAGADPNSVRWLEQNSHITEDVEASWAAGAGGSGQRSALRLSIGTLDELVGEAFARQTGPRDLLDALTRRQLVDTSLRTLSDEAAIGKAHRHRSEIIDLLAAIQGDGYDSPSAIDKLVASSDTPERAGTLLTATATRYHELLETVTTDTEYTGAEAYRGVDGVDIADQFPETDVIVVSGHYDLTTSERRLIEQLADGFELIITLPTVETRADHRGVNEPATDAVGFYTDLATETDRVNCAPDDPLRAIAGRLYTPPSAPSSDSSRHSTELERLSTDNSVRWIEAPTPDREVRQVARSIKHRVATDSGFTQDDTLVVVPGLISYREHVEDIFTAHGLTPVTFVNKLLYQTNTGRAMLDLVTLCRNETADAHTVASLGTNPAVEIGLDETVIVELTRSLPVTDLESLRAELGGTTGAALDDLVNAAEDVRTAEDTVIISSLRELFEDVGLDSEETPFADASGFDAKMERRTIRRVDRALSAIRRVISNTSHADPLDLIADELDQIRVPPPSQSTDGVLEVAGPREAFGQSYGHLYFVGLTNRDFPPDPDRPVFFEKLWAGLDGVEPTDHRAVARYQFGTMLASAESVYITTPEASSDGSPLIESSVLDELRRVTGITPETDDIGIATTEDAQRAVGRTLGLNAAEAVERLGETDVFDSPTAARASNGVDCATGRASPTPGAYDGQLHPETVDALYPASEREPYSPSRLTAYAKCGFRFLMDRIMDADDSAEFKLEPDPLDLGSVLHDTLERFYRGRQEHPGDNVDLTAYPQSELETQLLAAGKTAVENNSIPHGGPFYTRWLESLFAGLAEPENNPSDTGPDRVHEAEQGLLVKFLEAELDSDSEAGPGWFEVQLDLTEIATTNANTDAGQSGSVDVGADGGAGTRSAIDLTLPDGQTVPVGGRIDRVTVDRSDSPPTGLVHDYKTGGGDLREAAEGVSFQLPLYALTAGRVLGSNGVETPFDAAFYTLSHGELGDGWDLSYYLGRYGEADDSEAHYQRLIEEETPRRIGDIVSGIEGGDFRPTVLDEETAGCRHCEFSDVCDVRYHMRREAISELDERDGPGYVPDDAREEGFLSAPGGDDR